MCDSTRTRGRPGMLAPAGDVPAFGSAITKLLDRPELRQSISRTARELILRHHSWTTYIERLETIFQAVVDRRPVAGL